MASRNNVVIIGGGVIGLTTAYVLAQRGVPSIVLDQADLGREASWAGAGILPPANLDNAATPFDRLRAHTVARFPAFSAELRERTGIDNGYLRCGGLILPCDDDECQPEEWHGAGVRTESLDDVRTLEPAVVRSPATSLPDMAQVRNPRHLEALIAATQTLIAPDGWPFVDLRAGEAAVALLAEKNRIDAITTTRGVIDADQFLLAAGAWSPRLLRPLGLSLPVEPIRGQIVLLNPGTPVIRRVIALGSRYLVPRAEGRILVGSTEEHAGFRKQNTASGVAGLLELATRLVPDLAAAAVEKTWSGLRPGSRDGWPYLGRLGDYDNLFVAAGHFRAGIQLSIGTAEAMADLLTGQPPRIDLAPFAPDRV